MRELPSVSAFLMHAPFSPGSRPLTEDGLHATELLHVEGFIRPNVRCLYTIQRSLVEHVEQFGPRYRYRDLYLAVDTLKNPLAVFEGLKRIGEEKSICV